MDVGKIFFLGILLNERIHCLSMAKDKLKDLKCADSQRTSRSPRIRGNDCSPVLEIDNPAFRNQLI